MFDFPRVILPCAWLAALCLGAGWALPARAATLAELEQILKRDNPQLQQARQAILAAQLQASIAGALPAPQFSVVEQANTGGPFDFNHASGFYAYYNLVQPFLWFGKRTLAADIARAQAQAVAAQYQTLELQLLAALKTGVSQLRALEQQLRFMDEDRQRLEQIKQASRVRYANHAAAYVDYLNAQVAASSLDNDRFALQKQLETTCEQINALLGRPSATPLSVEGHEEVPHLPAEPLQALIAQAQQANPSIAASQAQRTAADQAVQLARKAFWPDFQLSLGSYADPSVVQLQTQRLYALGLSLSLPTWGLRKERAGLDQARAQLDEARAAEESTRQQVEQTIAADYHALETALKQLEFTRDRLLPQAQMAYQLALRGYASGGDIAFSELLQAQSGLRAAELARIQAETAARQAYVNLAAAVGYDPQ